MEIGVTLSIVGLVCGFFYFASNHLIKRNFDLQDRNERIRHANTKEDLDSLANEIYQLRSQVRQIQDKLIVIESNQKVTGKDVARIAAAHQSFGEKVVERFERIETEFLTILKGGK